MNAITLIEPDSAVVTVILVVVLVIRRRAVRLLLEMT